MQTGKRQSIRLSLLAGGLAALSWSAAGVAQEGYVISGTGDVVISGTGDCVYSGNWTPEDAIARCDPELVPAEQVVQAEPRDEVRRIQLDADTTFGFDEATLTPEGQGLLDQIAETALSDRTRNANVRVAGYTDRIGPEEYNLELSERRAEAVRSYLVERGVPEESITIAARGEAEPVVSCEGESGVSLIECLRPNRRSEIEFAAFEVLNGAGAEPLPESQLQQQPLPEPAPQPAQ